MAFTDRHEPEPYATDLAGMLDRLPCPPGSEREVVLVVEGPADVIAVWHAAPHAAVIGLPGGSGVARWAPMLAGLDVLVAFDADDAGDRAAASLAAALPASDGRSIRARPPGRPRSGRASYRDSGAAPLASR